LKILIDFGEPMLDHKLVARLLQHEHKCGWAIFTERDYKKAVGLVVRKLFEAAVGEQHKRDAEANRKAEVTHEA
jgi:hypothetical protein